MAEEKTVKKLDVQQLVDKQAALEKRDAKRNSSYDEVLTFYGGATLKEIRKQGSVPGISGALSSIFQPRAQEADSTLTTPINLVKPAIENKVAFLALQPTIRVIEPPDNYAPMAQPNAAMSPVPGAPAGAGTPPATAGPGMPPTAAPAAPPTIPPGAPQMPGMGTDDWATDFADRLEKVIHNFLDLSNMPQRCRDVAWSMCAMDGAVIGVWPDFRHECPRFFTRTPQDFYPVSYDPDGLELSFALWTEEVTGSEAVAQYPELDEMVYGDRETVLITKAIDEGFFYTMIDKQEWCHEPMENKTGIVPIVCVGALGLPGMIFGSTDIKDAIPVAKQINYHMALIDEMAGALARPTIAIKDPLNVPETIEIGRGGTITMGAQGNVELLGPLNLPNAFWQMGQTLQQWFDLISDNPNVLRSDDGGGLSTGKGFNAKLGPIAARMQTRLEILMMAWRQAIKYALIMWANFPGLDKKVTATGTIGTETYAIEATPDEFKVNGKMWTEIDVFLEAQSYMDRQGTSVEVMQLYQNELISWDDAVEQLSLVKNKKRTRKGIERDRQWKAEGMAIQQQAANSAMTANPSMMDQQYTNYGLERGMMGEMPVPGMKEGEMPKPEDVNAGPVEQLTPGAETGAPGGEIVGLIQEFFAGIGNLRGAVWFGGDPVLNPEKLAGDDWKVDVWCADPQDIGTITRAAEKNQVLYGHIRFHKGEPDPAENAQQVSQGSMSAAPAEPQAGNVNPDGSVTEEPELPEGEEMPDLASILGGGV